MACQRVPPNPTLKITVDPKESTSTVNLVGCITHVITDKEKVNFGFTDSVLKEAVAKLNCNLPTDVYVKGPVPGYEKDWSEITVNVVPQSVKVVWTDNYTDVVATHEHFNTNCGNVKYNGAICHNVTEFATNIWMKEYLVNVTQNLDCDLRVEGNKECITKFSYLDPWGEPKTVAQTVTLKAAADKEIDLGPGKSAVTKLIANKGSVELEVVFEAKASGDVLCFYKEPLDGCNYWLHPLSSLGLNTSVFVRQRIFIEYYSDVKVDLKHI